jgi:Zn-dependent protease/CBS domain-containing protein
MIGLTLGRIFGTEVKAHWSWIVVLALIAVVFGTDLSDGTLASWPIPLAWGSSIATALLVFASVTAHELAHVVVARMNGEGGPVVVVQLLGGAYVVDVKPKTPLEELRISLAGPALSLLLALAFGAVVGLLLLVVPGDNVPDGIQAVEVVAALAAMFNVLLAFINLVPGYPLDGAHVVHALVWLRTGEESKGTAAAGRFGRYVGLALMGSGFVIAVFGDDLLIGLCLVVAGWLMVGSSRFLDRRVVVEELFSGLHVGDAEESDPARVPPQLTLDTFASEYVGERMGAAALVERGSELLGLIGTAQIRRIPRRNWTRTRTEQAMVRIADVPTVNHDADLWSALEAMERTGLDALLVATGPSGPALITRRSVAKLVHERAEERQREMTALGLDKKGRFRGR